jgi:hypothetical protein
VCHFWHRVLERPSVGSTFYWNPGGGVVVLLRLLWGLRTKLVCCPAPTRFCNFVLSLCLLCFLYLSFERRILRKIFGCVRDKGDWRTRHNAELNELSEARDTVRFVQVQRMWWLGHVERMSEKRMPNRMLNGRAFSRRRPRTGWILYAAHRAYCKLSRTNQQLQTKCHKVTFTAASSLHVSVHMPSYSGGAHRKTFTLPDASAAVALCIPWRWRHLHWNV